jgi:outer membrane protein assembly factor BamB
MRVLPVLVVGFHLSWGAWQVAAAHEWPQWRGPQRDGVWRETGLIERFEAADIKLRWRVPISSGYSGPTVAADRVYVMDRLIEPEQLERVHCLDWRSGKALWVHTYSAPYVGIGYPAGPRASVSIDAERAYSLGAAGHLFCFDAAGGEVIWSHDLAAKYDIQMPNWGIAAAPLVEGDLLIVQIGGADGACVVAFDKHTGQPRWTAVEDAAAYAAPIAIDQAGQRVVICRTAGLVVGLAPSSGAVLWSFSHPWEQWPIAISTPVVERDLLFLSDAHTGSLLLRLNQQQPAVQQVWHRRKEDLDGQSTLHCLNSTPYIDGDYIYGADNDGMLRCLRLDTGEQVWEDRTAVPKHNFATVHLIRQGDRTWLFNDRGELILARLTPEGFQEISRAQLLEPTRAQDPRRRGGVAWAHPAFAYGHVFNRNDVALVCADLTSKAATADGEGSTPDEG